MMHGPEKSDPAIVAGKPPNEAGMPAEEGVEPRAGAEGNAGQQSTCRAQNRESVSQALERVRHVLPSSTRGGSRMRGAIGEADASLPVRVWSVQSLASRTGASLAGVAATRGPKRRQRLDGVGHRLPK